MDSKRKKGQNVMGKLNIKSYTILCIVFCILVMILFVFIKSRARDTHEAEQTVEETATLGDIEITESITEEPTDEYIATPDDELVYNDYYVGFTNLSLVYDYLTLEATAHISDEAAKYLNDHGFSHIHELTVIEDSIIRDKAYPKFECQMKGVDDKVLEIRYDLSKMEFEFQLLTKE